MFFLFSGEGPTDLGTGDNNNEINEGQHFRPGPLVYVVDQLVEEKHRYSPMECNTVGFVTKAMLTSWAKNLSSRKKISLPGPGEPKETRFFYKNARAMAQIARSYSRDKKDDVVAVLFRDADDCDRGNWEAKRQSMLHGFKEKEDGDEGFDRGVPMIPKSVSEAWMLCGLYKQRDSHRDCHFLENKTYGSGDQHQLKDRLETELRKKPDQETLNEKVKSKEINFDLVDLDSYVKFKTRLHEAI